MKWFWCLKSIRKYFINFKFVTHSFSCWAIIVFFSIFYSTLSFLRYLQSKFTTHEKLNRVKNIFRNCCSILLNYEKIKYMNKQQNVWNSNAYKLINKIFNKIFNCLLMIIESKFSHQNLIVFIVFAFVLIFDVLTIVRFNVIQQIIEIAWNVHR